MSNELGVESFIDEEESDLINSLFLDGVDSSDSILNSQKREGDEERALGGVSEKELSGVNEKELIGVEKEAGQSQDVKETFEGVDDKEDAFEGVSDVGATEEKAVANEKEVVVNEEEVVMVAEEKEEKKSEEMVIEEEEKEEKNEEKEEKEEKEKKEEKKEEKEEEKEEKEKKEEENEKDEQNAKTTNEKEENTTNNEKQEQNNTKPTRRSTRIQNRKPSPPEETTEDAQPENAPVPIDIVEDSVVINPPSALRVQQDIHISEPRKMTLRPRTKKSPTTQRTKKSPTKRTKKSPSKRTKRANTEMLSQPPAVEEAVRKRRRRDTDCETQRSEVGLEERVRHSRNERRSEANARLIELGILRTTTSSDVWRARWQ